MNKSTHTAFCSVKREINFTPYFGGGSFFISPIRGPQTTVFKTQRLSEIKNVSAGMISSLNDRQSQ